VTEEFFKGFRYWKKLTGYEGGFVVYGGNMVQKRSDGVTVVPLDELDLL